MLTINWNEEIMSVGIYEIDEQHKRLMELLNNVIQAIENNNQINEIEQLIEKASLYSNFHFSTEEEYFEKLNLNEKDIMLHKEKHNSFFKKVNDLSLKLKSDRRMKNNYGIEITTELNSFLSGWLINHILREDKQLLLNKIDKE